MAIGLDAFARSSSVAKSTPLATGEGTANYGVQETTNVRIQMSDGVMLFGTEWYPTDLATGSRAPGTFPVLIAMTPYGVDDGSSHVAAEQYGLTWANYFVPRGYIYLMMDVRGTGRSNGDFTSWDPKQNGDWIEVIDYAAHKLLGSNGIIGTHGMSYLAMNQILMGTELRPGTPVKAMSASAVPGSVWRDTFFKGGMPTAFTYAYGGIEAVSEPPPPDQVLAPGGIDAASILGFVSGRAETAPFLAQFQLNIATSGYMAYEDNWWLQRRMVNGVTSIVEAGVPVLMTSGLPDFFRTQSLTLYTAFQNAYHGRSIWAPMDPTLPSSGRYPLVWSTFADGQPSYALDYERQWFDHWLKGTANGVGNSNNSLHIMEFPEQRWVRVPGAVYPMTDRYTPLYLSDNASLSEQPPSAASASDELSWDEASTQVYESAPFTEGAVLAGPIALTIFATTTAPDVELVPILYDVAPDASAAEISRGALIGSQRTLDEEKTWFDADGRPIYPYHPYLMSTEQPVPMGEIVRLDVEMAPNVWSLEPGHHLRLVVGTQWTSAATEGATTVTIDTITPPIPTAKQVAGLAGGVYAVQRGSGAESYINLPILPYGSFPTATDPTKVGLAADPSSAN